MFAACLAVVQTDGMWRRLGMRRGSKVLGAAVGAMEKFEASGARLDPVWLNGEYAFDIARPSYFLADGRFLVRHAPSEADGDDWYGSEGGDAAAVLASLGLPSQV